MIDKITNNIQAAVTLLKAGELIAFPTETVYGLAADASNPEAIKKVFTAKGRPADHPLIVHIESVQQLSLWAKNIPASAYILADKFWPGPLTLILQKQDHVSKLITGGQDTIGLRVPNHALTLELLQQFNGGLVGPSANKYGRVSPTTAEHVANDFGPELALILDGGKCSVGIESTIVDLSGANPRIMRQGEISAAEISSVLDQTVNLNNDKEQTIRFSGSHESHYAPLTPVYLLAYPNLLEKLQEFIAQHKSCSVLSFQTKPVNIAPDIHWQQVSMDPKDYAHDLYANLRAHDALKLSAILIESVPKSNAWDAIADRLARASFKWRGV